MSEICSFCEHERALVVHAPESKIYEYRPTICASCVWRCVDVLVEHSGVREPLSPAATHRLLTETRS